MAQNINAIKGDVRAKGEDVLVVAMTGKQEGFIQDGVEFTLKDLVIKIHLKKATGF